MFLLLEHTGDRVRVGAISHTEIERKFHALERMHEAESPLSIIEK